ncbi:MAG: hypothetical protein ACFFD1_11055, partial [Candidatus Thorarchaeota archaeon]
IDLKSSTGLEGAEDIVITKILRNVNVSGSGVINVADALSILNTYNNPIVSILFGIPMNLIDDLIYFKAVGTNDNSLLVEQKDFIMNDNEMFTIYFDSPLLPNQEISIKLFHSYVNLPIYYLAGNEQYINFSMNIFPLLPYKTEKNVTTIITLPQSSEVVEFEKVKDIGVMITSVIYSYDLSESLELNFLQPFLQNIDEQERVITFSFKNSKFTKMQIDSITREIFISAWGIIRVKDEILIENNGLMPVPSFSLNVPKSMKNLQVYDDIGDLAISDLSQNEENPELKTFSINLGDTRATLAPGSKYQFNVEYELPFEEYTSSNWLEQSIKINLMTTTHEFYVMDENINLIIEGCNSIEFISKSPDEIRQSRESTIITYIPQDVSPIETFVVQLTFTVDLFNLTLRPLTIALIFALLMSFYVVLTKTRKRKIEKDELSEEFIPFNEVREFCSLYEEKNALVLEIRRVEDEAKRKKMAKKTYKSILSKNSTKIEQIKKEILPFKETLIDANETFENIIKKLDVLDAERISVDDSLNLLETRYKRGRLPSKAAYQKLSDDFEKRRKKIDRTIDKLIQQLRSYLL